eukprot:SAG31_NODE_5034_length_2787_cov_5.411086_2_plen_84_part_00
MKISKKSSPCKCGVAETDCQPLGGEGSRGTQHNVGVDTLTQELVEKEARERVALEEEPSQESNTAGGQDAELLSYVLVHFIGW